ncbi:MAG TPA: hypothetical protein VIU29_11220, partial [Candidatus Deferrimicrobiaceae bacterium]
MSDKKCELLETCIFFNDKMADMPGTAAMYKRQFCLGDNSRCARFMVVKTIGREHVPATLFPNQLQ